VVALQSEIKALIQVLQGLALESAEEAIAYVPEKPLDFSLSLGFVRAGVD